MESDATGQESWWLYQASLWGTFQISSCRPEDVALLVECLLRMHEALGLVPSTTQTRWMQWLMLKIPVLKRQRQEEQ